MAAYNELPDWQKQAFKRETDLLFYNSYQVDEANLFVTITFSHSNL